MPMHAADLQTPGSAPGPALGSRPGRPVLLPSRAHEVSLALDAVGRAQGGYIWTAPVGTGKSSLLELVVDALASRPPHQPHVVVHLTARPQAAAHPGAELDAERFPGGPRSGAPPAAGELAATTDTLVGQPPRRSGIEAPEHLRRFLSGATTPHAGPEAACAALARYVRDTLPGVTLVVVIDDIDDLDDASRTLALDLVAHHQIPAVLLAGAARITWDTPLPYPVAVRKIAPLSAQETLRLLTHHHRMEPAGLTSTAAASGVAPSVAGALAHQLDGNTACIVQTAAELAPAQLDGTSILPNPLPAVPALAELHSPALADLSPTERRTLLVAAVTVVDRTDVLLAAAAITMEKILATPLADLLRFAGGRFTFAHLGVRALVHAEATVAERTEAHAALAEALLVAGLRDGATWHRTLASLAGDPQACPELLAIAQRLIDRGDVVHAHEVAREAACQCEGRDRAAAERLAGIAALRSGHVRDAAEWLRPAMRSDDLEVAACALPAYVVAVAAHRGQVPDDDIAHLVETFDPTRDAPAVAGGLVRALAISGRIHAERGEGDLAVAALTAARTLTCESTSAATLDVLAVEASWASMFSPVAGTSTAAAVAGAVRSADRQTFASTARALQLALAGDLDGAARLLAHAVTTLSPLHDGGTWWAISERAASPFAEAHLRVAKALVDMWSGDFLRAGDELHLAAFRLPISLPFAGLGTAAARRLSVLRTGYLDDVASALTAVSTAVSAHPVRIEARTDRSILAALSGAPSSPPRFAQIAEDGADTRPAAVGGAARFPQLPGMAHDVASAGPTALASAYQRAHRELTTGRAHARTGLSERALEHLQSAVELFSLTGAHAWTRIAEADLDHLAQSAGGLAPGALLSSAGGSGLAVGAGGADGGSVGGSATGLVGALATGSANEPAGGSVSGESGDAPVGIGPVLHRRWGTLLTQRELDVALLVVQGASNRDVAQALHLSVRTVEVHLGRVFRKTGSRSRVALTVLAHATA